MMQTDLDKRFEQAFEQASKMEQQLPPDVMLRIYAYYKQATHGTIAMSREQSNNDLRNAFKTNAWMQISHLSVNQAKEKYIELIQELIIKKSNNQ